MAIEQTHRVILTRLTSNSWNPGWDIISNPSWDYFSDACSRVLNNSANRYVEYENCGVVYRMVRVKDLVNYEISAKNVLPEWVLAPAREANKSV